ncbi:hypothetical protein QJS66_08195 [Kocuria rhizophila]|nr:hypothetical protein QJS66_08195 [Kocuria rhizophila]
MTYVLTWSGGRSRTRATTGTGPLHPGGPAAGRPRPALPVGYHVSAYPLHTGWTPRTPTRRPWPPGRSLDVPPPTTTSHRGGHTAAPWTRSQAILNVGNPADPGWAALPPCCWGAAVDRAPRLALRGPRGGLRGRVPAVVPDPAHHVLLLRPSYFPAMALLIAGAVGVLTGQAGRATGRRGGGSAGGCERERWLPAGRRRRTVALVYLLVVAAPSRSSGRVDCPDYPLRALALADVVGAPWI